MWRVKLKRWLEREGRKKIWLARKIGVSRQTIHAWLSGQSQPSPANIRKIISLVPEISEKDFKKSEKIYTRRFLERAKLVGWIGGGYGNEKFDDLTKGRDFVKLYSLFDPIEAVKQTASLIKDIYKWLRHSQRGVIDTRPRQGDREAGEARIFFRIQAPNTKWNPKHRSRHPKHYRPGVIYHHGEGEWVELPGLASFPLKPKEAVRAILGLDFTVATREDFPELLDWDDAGVDEIKASDLTPEYNTYLFIGRKVQDLPDGAVAEPVPATSEAIRQVARWLVEHKEEIEKDDKLKQEIETLYGKELNDDVIEDIIWDSYFDDEDTGLIKAQEHDLEKERGCLSGI